MCVFYVKSSNKRNGIHSPLFYSGNEASSLANDLNEIERIKKELKLIQNRPIPVTTTGKPCIICNLPLTDPPIVFYKCLHGYHKHCCLDIDGNVEDCKICVMESRHKEALLNQRRDSAHRSDELFKTLGQSDNCKKFEILMSYLGRGIFN